MIEIQRFDPTECRYPHPSVPLLPSLEWRNITFDGVGTTPRALLAPDHVRHFSRGRYAMHAAYKAAGVGSTGALLAPSYHCRTMLDGAQALGGGIHLYEVNADLTPNMSSIKWLIANARTPIKALVLTHYFGFEQPQALTLELADLCEHHDITLVEDCSHAWMLVEKRLAVTQVHGRHLLIGSPYKFYGCEDGGTLWGAPWTIFDANVVAPGMSHEFKGLLRALTRSWRHTSMLPPTPTGQLADDFIGGAGQDIREPSERPSASYLESHEQSSSLALSRWVMRHTKLAPVVLQRQKNYRQWVSAVAGLTSAKALFPELPAECSPYMFALYLDRPEQHFDRLKHMGLPIWRWDEVAVSDCPVASDFRLRLIHLPCHQSLTAAQMAWMIDLVLRVLP